MVNVLVGSYSCQELVCILDKASESTKLHLQHYFSSACDAFADDHVKLLRQLPLFQLESDAGHFVSMDAVPQACLKKPQVQRSVPLLDLSTKEARKLAECLGVLMLSCTEYLRKYVFSELPSMSDDEVKIIVDFIISNWAKLQEEDAQIVDTLCQLKFVPTNKKGNMCPTDLFSPNDSILVQLFWDQDVFPGKWMVGKSYLFFLEQLGLKGLADVTSADLIGAAECLERLNASSESAPVEQLERKAEAMLKCVSDNRNLVSCQLDKISWLPVLQKPIN